MEFISMGAKHAFFDLNTSSKCINLTVHFTSLFLPQRSLSLTFQVCLRLFCEFLK